jgi:hypothetical protein
LLPLDQVGEDILDRPPTTGHAGPRHLTGRQERESVVERRALTLDLVQQFLLAESPAHECP